MEFNTDETLVKRYDVDDTRTFHLDNYSDTTNLGKSPKVNETLPSGKLNGDDGETEIKVCKRQETRVI